MVFEKKLKKYFIILLLLLLPVTNKLYGQGELFQAGLYAEYAEGNPEKAISFYQKIVHEFPNEKNWAAKALLRLGLCYEKSGRDGAIKFYNKIVAEFPEQKNIAALARKRLKHLQGKKSVNKLVKYYFDRTGIDPLSSVSFDGNYLARTDWASGNLVMEEIATGKIRTLTNTNWKKSSEYAVQPTWSRDGKFIAFSWFREPSFLELRIASLSDGKIKTVYSDPKLYIYPQDWSPDGISVLCEVYDFRRKPANFLALISLNDHKLRKLIPSSSNSRGFMFSPDGKFISYDLLGDAGRQIMVFSSADSSTTQITNINIGRYGFDNPIWNDKGNLLLYRSNRLGKFDLWATPIKNGKSGGESFLVQPDLSQYLFFLKGIDTRTFKEISVEEQIKNKPVEYSFAENFSNPSLIPAWSVFSWKKANIYDFKHFGKFSLTDHPGYLRYYLTPATAVGYVYGYLPHFTNWYWYYPSLELSRSFWGDHWELETKFTFFIPSGANTRRFNFNIFFLAKNNKILTLSILRKSGFPKGKLLELILNSMGSTIAKNKSCLSAADSAGVAEFTYIFKILRNYESLQVNLSEDGKNFRQILAAAISKDYRGCTQLLALSSSCWFVPAGSYLDWDYIRVKALDAEH